MELAEEWQFDGLVGPTHNYAGLAFGNLAAKSNAGAVSNPRAAALQGLEKMRFVRNMGVKQAFIPPHYRPHISELKRLGFTGKDLGELLEKAARYSPALLASVYSSSFMWTANAATITPSVDAADGKVHITPANMASHYHRAIESEFTQKILKNVFHNTDVFSVHNFLFHHASLGDEGAANHMLVCMNHGLPGLHIFVVGENHESSEVTTLFPARQRHIASESIARLHNINEINSLYLQQSPAAIDFGVFHNDVIAMNSTRLMIVHEHAFTPEDQKRLRAAVSCREGVMYREVTERELSIPEAVSTYLFNSQLIDFNGKFVLVAPGEAQAHPKSRELVQAFVNEGLLNEVHYLDLRESMRNGGGPACLRLRVSLTASEAAHIHPGVILTDAKYQALVQWVSTHYRDRLQADDLRDPAFVAELNVAYLALEEILEMPNLYREQVAQTEL